MSYQQTHRVSVPGLWLTTFSATLAAILVGSLLVGLSLRLYIHWSVADTVQQLREKSTNRK